MVKFPLFDVGYVSWGNHPKTGGEGLHWHFCSLWNNQSGENGILGEQKAKTRKMSQQNPVSLKLWPGDWEMWCKFLKAHWIQCKMSGHKTGSCTGKTNVPCWEVVHLAPKSDSVKILFKLPKPVQFRECHKVVLCSNGDFFIEHSKPWKVNQAASNDVDILSLARFCCFDAFRSMKMMSEDCC